MITKFWCLNCGLELCRYDTEKDKFQVFTNPTNFKDGQNKRVEKNKKYIGKSIIQFLPIEIITKDDQQNVIVLSEKDWQEGKNVYSFADDTNLIAEFVKTDEGQKVIKVDLQKVLNLWVSDANAICLNKECGAWYHLRTLKDENTDIEMDLST